MATYTIYQDDSTAIDWEPSDGCDTTDYGTTITIFVSYDNATAERFDDASKIASDRIEDFAEDVKQPDEIDEPESFEQVPEQSKPCSIFRKVQPMARPPPELLGGFGRHAN